MMFFNFKQHCNASIFLITSLLSFVAVTAASTCTETSYFGYNTDFVHIYNTKNGTESPGDTWTWHANVTSAGESDEFNPDLLVGELVGYCIRTPAGFWECDETIIMNAMGSLYVHYVQMPPATQSTAGILGGTDSYKSGVSGQIVFTAPSTNDGPWKIDMELCMPSSSTSSSSPLIYGGRKLPALLFGLMLFL